MEIPIFVYRASRARGYVADCGFFGRSSRGRNRNTAVYNLTRKLRRKVDEASRREPVTIPYRNHEFCDGNDLVLGDLVSPDREFDLKVKVERDNETHEIVHRMCVYHLRREDLR